MYVANYNTNSVSAINTVLNVVSNSVAVGVHPVSLAETPNGLKLYVANQGSNSVSTLNTASLSPNTANGLVAGFTGITPVWVVARGDSQKVYVLTQGDGATGDH
jgi:YVTN family beta-propeller protein